MNLSLLSKFFLISLFSFQTIFSQNQVQWSAQARQTDDSTYDVVINASIIDNWKLYSTDLPEGGPLPTVLKWKNSTQIEKLQTSLPKSGYDPIFLMELSYYEKEATFIQKVKNNSKQIDLIIEYQACDDKLCIFREEVLSIPTDGRIINASGKDLTDISTAQNPLKLDFKNTFFIDETLDKQKGNLFEIFILGFLGGFLALLTPCIFPLIPLTVSYFSKSSSSKVNAIRRSLIYTVSIISIYFVLSTPFFFLDQLRPEILNSIATNVFLNLLFFAVFCVFALSFFGLFDLTLPTRWASASDSISEKTSIFGIFFMALTLAIVSFSCTGPILGSLLVGSLTAEAGAVQLSIGMVGFGTALALPFGLLSFFPNIVNKIPKSGGWMQKIKVSLGFIELALALKFLSNADMVQGWGLLPREIFLLIWITIFLFWAIYLFGGLGFLKFKSFKASIFQKIIGTLVIVFVIYLTQGIFSAKKSPLKILSGFPPPTFYSIKKSDSNCPLGINCFKDFQTGLDFAKDLKKPILIDFTGWACVNCRKIEENVWTRPEIFKILNEEIVLISLYVDDKTPLNDNEKFDVKFNDGSSRLISNIGQKWSTFQALNFKSVSQPYYVLIDPDLKILNPPIQYTNAIEYKAWLEDGLKNSRFNN